MLAIDRARAPCHRHAVARRDVRDWSCRDKLCRTRRWRGRCDRLRIVSTSPVSSSSDVDAEAAIFGGEAEFRGGDEIDRHVIFEQLDIASLSQRAQKRVLDFAPVTSCTCRTRRLECPPSRPRSSSRCPEISRSSKCTPNSISSLHPLSGPSVTIVRTTASSQSPRPASSVSRTCSSKESSSLVTQATPPCAHAVFDPRPCVS